MERGSCVRRVVCAALLLGSLALPAALPAAASAQDPLQLSFAVGAGSLYSRDQLGYLGYIGLGGGLAVGASYDLWGPLAADGRSALSAYVSERPTGSLFELGAGLRLGFEVPGLPVEAGPAVHVNLAQTGTDTRPSVDLSLRGLWRLSEVWWLGPELLVDRVVQTAHADHTSTDADLWLVSAVLAYRSPAPAPPPRPIAKAPPPPPAPPPAPPQAVVWQPPAQDAQAAPPSEELTALLDQVVTERIETRLLAPVLFEFDSTRLTACGEAALFYARDVIGQMGDKVLIEGHADGTGDEAYNQALSEQRAQFVLQWMVAHGVPSSQLEAVAEGERRLLVQEPDGHGDKLNRRVTFVVVEEPAP